MGFLKPSLDSDVSARVSLKRKAAFALSAATLGVGSLTGFALAGAPTASASGVNVAAAFYNGNATIDSLVKMSAIGGTGTGTVTLNSTSLQPGGTSQVDLAQSAINFQVGSTTWGGFLPIKTILTPTSDMTGTASFNQDGSLAVSVSGTVSAQVKLGPFDCPINTIQLALTTGTSGSLTGTSFAGATSNALPGPFTGTLVDGKFTVPAMSSGGSCPSFIAGILNLLSGFPAKSASMTISSTMLVSLNAPQNMVVAGPASGTTGNAYVIGVNWPASSSAILQFSSGSSTTSGNASVDANGSLGGLLPISSGDATGSNPITVTDGSASGSAPFNVG